MTVTGASATAGTATTRTTTAATTTGTATTWTSWALAFITDLVISIRHEIRVPTPVNKARFLGAKPTEIRRHLVSGRQKIATGFSIDRLRCHIARMTKRGINHFVEMSAA